MQSDSALFGMVFTLRIRWLRWELGGSGKGPQVSGFQDQ